MEGSACVGGEAGSDCWARATDPARATRATGISKPARRQAERVMGNIPFTLRWELVRQVFCIQMIDDFPDGSASRLFYVTEVFCQAPRTLKSGREPAETEIAAGTGALPVSAP